MLSKFVGETEKNVRDLFADAEQDQKTKGKGAIMARNILNSKLGQFNPHFCLSR